MYGFILQVSRFIGKSAIKPLTTNIWQTYTFYKVFKSRSGNTCTYIQTMIMLSTIYNANLIPTGSIFT